MFQFEFTPGALAGLRELRKFDQQQVVDAIEAQLAYQPTEETRNRKHLRPNELAEWELRIGDFRVFYDVEVEQAIVRIAAVGHKQGNQLFIRGREYKL